MSSRPKRTPKPAAKLSTSTSSTASSSSTGSKKRKAEASSSTNKKARASSSSKRGDLPPVVAEFVDGKSFSDDHISKLLELRTLVLESLPKECTEKISYGVCGVYLADKYVLYYAVTDKHYALYGSNATLSASLQGRINALPIKQAKGTIRFALKDDVKTHATLIRDVCKERLAEARAKKK